MRSPTFLITLLLLASSPSVLAQTEDRTRSLGKVLKTNAISANRVEAARQLGASEDPEALQPLCDGLLDEAEEVRVVVAEGLAKLGEPGGVECLEARQEASEKAKTANEAALRTLRELKARPAKWYVKLDALKDVTGSLSPELMKLTEARMRRRLFQVGTAVAPAKESVAEAKGALTRQKLKGYLLRPEVRAGPSGGLMILVLCMRYPGKEQLLGQVHVQAADGEPGELLAVLAPSAIDEAMDTFKGK